MTARPDETTGSTEGPRVGAAEARGADSVGDIIQGAALEAIKAMRAFLDIAESLVREPGTAAVVGKAFAEAATTLIRPATGGDERDDDGDDDASTARHQGVRRIHLSD